MPPWACCFDPESADLGAASLQWLGFDRRCARVYTGKSRYMLLTIRLQHSGPLLLPSMFLTTSCINLLHACSIPFA